MLSRLATTMLLAAITAAQAVTVDEILDQMEKNENPKTSRAEVTETVFRADGSSRESKLVSYGFGEGEKSLMEYVSPARIKGMKVLSLNDGDDIWMFSARTGRVRKIASGQRKQSANNSDFSYEDMSTRDRRADYNCTLEGEETRDGVQCYRIDMTSKTPDKTYSKMVFWVDKEKMVGVAGEMYDETGTLWKRLTVSGLKKVAGYWTPQSVEMKNLLKDSRTVMKMDKIEYDIELDEGMFSERNLKR